MTTVKTKLFSIDEYHRLIDLGVFTQSNRIELIKGQLESYTQPYQKPNGEYGYLSQQIYVADRSISLPGFAGILLELDRIFPR